MHNPNISQRRRQVMLLLSYVIMTAIVLTVSVICLMLILGYRFDANSNRFEQGGLIQFRTVPASSSILFDDRKLNFTTPGRLNVTTGQHTVEYSRDGYLPWQKTVDIAPGELRWLNYARLIPEKIKTDPVAELDGYSQSLASPDRSFIAVVQDESEPVITMMDIRDQRQINIRNIELDPSQSKEEKAKLRLIEWDANSRYVLFEQAIGKEKEFIRVDRTDSNQPIVNISDVVRLGMSQVNFYRGSNSQLLARTGDSLRLINLSNETISNPIITEVEDYSLINEDEIVFLADRDERRVAGVYVDEKESVVRTFDEEGEITLGMGAYYAERYLAVAHQDKLELIISPETKEGAAGRNFVELGLPFTPHEVSFSPTGRFVMAVKGLEFYVYDLELEEEYSFSHPGNIESTAKAINWIDSYYLASTQDSQAFISEFDGHNQHKIADVVQGSQVTFDDDGEYLYSFAKDGDKYSLQRSQLVID